MKRRHPELVYPENAIFAVVRRELSVTQTIWRSRRLLDEREKDDHYSYLDDMVREQADHSLEHVFSLLATVLPREPLLASFRGLHHDDWMFRGLALEYLENVLPEDVRGRLWELIGESPPQASRDAARVTAELIRTSGLLKAHPAVLTPDGRGDPEPNDGKPGIDPSETSKADR